MFLEKILKSFPNLVDSFLSIQTNRKKQSVNVSQNV